MNPSDQAAPSREVQLTSVVLVNIMAAIIAGAYALMRQGLDTTTIPAAMKTLGLAWLLLNVPVFIHCWCIPAGWRDRAFYSMASLAWLTLAVLAGAGWLVRFLGLNNPTVYWAPAAVGAALAAWHLLAWLLSRRILWTVCFLLFAAFLGLAASLMVFTNEFHQPLLMENLRQGSFPHNDTYFHVAIAGMIDLHGVSSTGLEGLVPLKYHVGSHWILTLLADLVGLDILQAYLLIYPVVFLPWFAMAILAFAQSCGSVLQGPDRGSRNDVVFWVVFLVGFLGFLPLPVGLDTRLTLSWSSNSESHLISLVLLMLFLSLCISYYRDTYLQQNHETSSVLTLIVMVTCSFLVLTFTKISIPMVVLPVGLWAVWRLKLYRQWWWVTAVALILGLVALIFISMAGFAAKEPRSFPFGYVFYNIPRQWWGLFFPCLFLWIGWYVYSRLRAQQVHTVDDLWQVVRQKKLIDVELAVLVLLLTSGPVLIYNSFGVFYFWEYQRWIGLALVLGSLGCWSLQRNEACEAVATDTPRSMRLSTVFVCIVLVCCYVTQGMNAYLSFKQYTLEMVQGRAATSEQAKALTEETNVAFRRFQIPQIVRLIRQATASRPGPLKKNTIDLLAELNRLPRQERKEALVYIPKHNRDFWDHLPAGINRLFTCFIAPAISGLPQLDGVPEYDPAFDYYYATAWKYLGFADYHLENHRPPQKPWREDLASLKKRTVEMGFKVLYVIDQNEQGNVYLERIPCQ